MNEIVSVEWIGEQKEAPPYGVCSPGDKLIMSRSAAETFKKRRLVKILPAAKEISNIEEVKK